MTTSTMPATAAPKPQPGAPRDYRFPHFDRRTLSNGIQLLVAPVAKLPLVSVLALVDAGASAELPGKQGVAALTARLLLEGAAGMDGNALADQFEQIGASVDAHGDWDVATVSLTVLSERVAAAVALVAKLIREPDFPEREVQRLKEQRLSDLLQQLAEPRELADEQFASATYSASSRYAQPEEGTSESVRALTRVDVLEFYSARYQPQAITLIFAGDVTTEAAAALAESLFGDWRGMPVAAGPNDVDTPRMGKLARVVAKSDAPQSEIRVGHAGVPRNVQGYFEIMLMNAVLGGLFSSRINLNLREAHGYTYGASSVFDWRRGAGPFVIQTAVKSDVTGPALGEILKEIDRMRTAEISEDELTLATSYLEGVFPIRYETTAAIAGALANLVIHSLPEDYYDKYRDNVRSVTAASVLRAAQEHLHPDELKIVVVGDPAVITAQMTTVTGVAPEVVASTGKEVSA